MSYEDILRTLDPTLIQRLRNAVETGRWPDGRPVTKEQRETSLQAVLAWEAVHLPAHERVGFIDKGVKSGASPQRQEQGSRTTDEAARDRDVQPLRWQKGEGGRQ